MNSGDYPLARPLYVYVNRDPEADLPALVREFLLFVLSEQGQKVVGIQGFVPLTGRSVQRERRTIDPIGASR